MLAEQRQRWVDAGKRHGRSLSINWPYWRDGGMRPGAYYEEQMFKQIGMRPLETAAGLRAFAAALDTSENQVGVIAGDAPRILEYLKLAPQTPAALNGSHTAPVARGGVESVVLNGLAEVFHLDPNAIEPGADIMSYGANSVMLTEFANVLNSAYQVRYSGSSFFELNSAERIIDHLRAQLGKLDERPRDILPRRLPSVIEPVEPAGAFAIIGYDWAGPGATDAEAYWRNVSGKVVSIRQVTAHEWRNRGVVIDGHAVTESMRWGGTDG